MAYCLFEYCRATVLASTETFSINTQTHTDLVTTARRWPLKWGLEDVIPTSLPTPKHTHTLFTS